MAKKHYRFRKLPYLLPYLDLNKRNSKKLHDAMNSGTIIQNFESNARKLNLLSPRIKFGSVHCYGVSTLSKRKAGVD